MAVERTAADWAEQAEAHAIVEAAAQDNTPLMRMLRPNPRTLQALLAAHSAPREQVHGEKARIGQK